MSFIAHAVAVLAVATALALPPAARLLEAPTRTETDAVTWTFPHEGVDVGSGERWDFLLPPAYLGRQLSHVLLRYRKDPRHGTDDASLVCHVHDPSADRWTTWADQFGAEKHAAVRPPTAPKTSTLYCMSELVGRFAADRVALEARGVITLHEVSLVFLTPDDRPPGPVVDRLADPAFLNALTLRYVVDESKGLPLRQNQVIEFIVPEGRRRPLQYAVLSHRKDPADAVMPEGARDPDPPYVLFQAHDPRHGCWHSWVDRYGSAKYPEVRPAENPEDEILHNCLKCLGSFAPDKVRLLNVGSGDPERSVARIHALDLVVAPNREGVRVSERIYTPETVFADPGAGRPVPLFGGGPRLGGRFPGALALGVRAPDRLRAIAALDEPHRFATTTDPGAPARVDARGRLHISLPAGERLEGLELALGDLDVTALTVNKDGYFGRSGRAEVSVARVVPGPFPSSTWLLRRQNVGMACLVTAAPREPDRPAVEGEELVVEVDFDVAFLMGWRLTTRPPAP